MPARGFLVLVIGLALGFAAVQLFHGLRAPATAPDELPTSVLITHPDCQLRQSACTAALGEQRVGLQFSAPVQALEPFWVEALVAGMAVREVQLEFTMKGMDMGQNRYRLLPSGEAWVGSVTLPVCVAGRSDWVATLTVAGDGRKWVAEFPFRLDDGVAP